MPDINDFVSDFSPRERAALDAALRTGEQVRWATRPHSRLSVQELTGYAVVELIALGFIATSCVLLGVLYATPLASMLHQALAASFFLAFMGVGLFLAFLPLREYRRRQQTLYVVTNHRALVFMPGDVQVFPLRAHMVRERICRPGGCGDLIFDAEGDEGFKHLPNLAQAHGCLNLAINDLLDAAERTAH